MAFLPQNLGLTVGDTVIYACLVPLFWYVIVHPEGLSGRLLNNRAVAHIGLLSFSIYLLHRLVLGLVEQVVQVAPVIDVLSLVVVIALAQGMYIAVEKPLGKVRKSLESRSLPEQIPTPKLNYNAQTAKSLIRAQPFAAPMMPT